MGVVFLNNTGGQLSSYGEMLNKWKRHVSEIKRFENSVVVVYSFVDCCSAKEFSEIYYDFEPWMSKRVTFLSSEREVSYVPVTLIDVHSRLGVKKIGGSAWVNKDSKIIIHLNWGIPEPEMSSHYCFNGIDDIYLSSAIIKHRKNYIFCSKKPPAERIN
jgi:hypothetical protein